jgi:hypothetical protein
MGYIAKIKRTYSFNGKIVQLETGKEVDSEFVQLFTAKSQSELFDFVPDEKPVTKPKKQKETPASEE